MSNRDIIVVGASAGGVETLQKLVAGLPANFPASVFVLMHLPAFGKSFLPQILSDSGPLPAKEAEDGESIVPGIIYVAPSDMHVLLGQDSIQLGRGPREGRQRPSINVTFRSAAMTYAERVIGVVLTGMLDDGTAGLWEIKRRGGLAVVQDPDDALFPSMPLSAMHEVAVDYRVIVAEMAALLGRLVLTSADVDKAAHGPKEGASVRFSGLTCPECRGPLWEMVHHRLVEFRCRVGHIYSSKMLLDEHMKTQERKFYEAVVALQEGAELSEFLAARVDRPDREQLIHQAEKLRQQAEDLRVMVEAAVPIE
jgi:two-component system chemotaxis response regulator CheB